MSMSKRETIEYLEQLHLETEKALDLMQGVQDDIEYLISEIMEELEDD